MRALSLLIIVAVVAYLAYTQLGSGSATASSPAQPAYQVAKQKAAAVDAQVQDQFAQQAEALSRMESGAPADSR